MQTDTDLSPAPPRQPQPPVAGPEGRVEFELGDGSRLVLDQGSRSPIVCRVDGADARITLADALRGNGQPFAGFRRLK